MMDLAEEVHDVLKTIKLLVKESETSLVTCKSRPSLPDVRSNMDCGELIDVNKVDFCDDETWLYESPIKNSTIKDLHSWLYAETRGFKDFDFHSKRLSLIREITQMDAKKNIDSRTFTRPKKRINRPSIEFYNEGYFKMDRSNTFDNNKFTEVLDNSLETLNKSKVRLPLCENHLVPESSVAAVSSQSQTPLRFDFNQPTTSSIFDKIVANAPDVDSFQNMSPPSLVNSMCSSTFANLMENSYIKNDPTLREIRDADLTEAMLEECEAPLLKSFTDSCSSINSDTPEGFLKRTVDATFSKLYKNNSVNDKENLLNDTYTADSGNDTTILNHTYQKENSIDSSSENSFNNGTLTQQVSMNQTVLVAPAPVISKNTSPSILNGTYRKSAKFNDTFKKSPPQYKSNELLNDDLNRTITIVDNVDSNRLNNTKRHSYIIDNRSCEANHTTNLKRNSVGYSAGSSDSLDYVSSLSNSSRGSNKMLNMAEVDAIVLQQEQSLQVNSTPKPSSKIISKLWENNCISPIMPLDRGDQLSDSESSSNEGYVTGGSGSTNMLTALGSDSRNSNKSLENLQAHIEMAKTSPRSLNTISAAKTAGTRRFENAYRGSYSNLKTVGTNLKGSYSNLRPTGASTKGSYSNLASTGSHLKGSYSNLKTMSNNLRGSYTQLKPVLTHLPYADTDMKIFNPPAGSTVSKPPVNSYLKKAPSANLRIAEVAPTLRDLGPKAQVKSASAINYSNKPQMRASGLPRSVSSIPRPTASRIPGPRTDRPTGLRPMGRPMSRVNFEGDF